MKNDSLQNSLSYIKTNYRNYSCGELNKKHVGLAAKLSGWIERKRDHGGLIFADLRDRFGITQIVSENLDDSVKKVIDSLHVESVVCVEGRVVERSDSTKRFDIPTGEVELVVDKLTILSSSEVIPFGIVDSALPNEKVRLEYRFLDLRRSQSFNYISFRSNFFRFLREKMWYKGIQEFQTPLLTGSSPEGARDFVVPSRVHKGMFFALPQAPQQFKQLLMCSGFDSYFQIAPCFRDEDPRSDRHPGEFYQLDIEFSFVEEKDVMKSVEDIALEAVNKFKQDDFALDSSIKHFTYEEAINLYASDKPDLRNPIFRADAINIFENSEFSIFAKNIKLGKSVKMLVIPFLGKAKNLTRKMCDDVNKYAIEKCGAAGLAYVTIDQETKELKGPIAKFFTEQMKKDLFEKSQSIPSVVFFICETEGRGRGIAEKLILHLGENFDLINKKEIKMCWITKFPFFEKKEDGLISFGHNPFSAIDSDINAIKKLNTKDELMSIRSKQYDLVCNGLEVGSGSIRNTDLNLLYELFSKLKYTKEDVDSKFKALVRGLKYGAPPHGGFAFGLERLMMILLGTSNIRDVIPFPLNGSCYDLLMSAPSSIPDESLNELGISIVDDSSLDKK